MNVPEERQRHERTKTALTDNIGSLRSLAWLIVLILCALKALLLWQRRLLKTKTALLVSFLYALGAGCALVLDFSQTQAHFSSATPPFLETLSFFLGQGTKIVFESLIIGLCTGVVLSTRVTSSITQSQKILASLAGGLFLAATQQFIIGHVYPGEPWFPSLAGASALLPAFVFLAFFVTNYIKQTVYLSVLIDAATTRSLGIIALLTAAVLYTPYEQAANVTQWLIALSIMIAAFYALYTLIIRAQPRTVPIITATLSLLALTKEASAHFFPGSLNGCILTGVFTLCLALILSNATTKQN